MRKLSSKLAGQQSGFTLIELVIVIVIIGILAAVAIPNFASVSSDAKASKCLAILGSVKSAYAIALSKNGGATPSAAMVLSYQTDPSCDAGACGDITTISPTGATLITSSSQITMTCNSA